MATDQTVSKPLYRADCNSVSPRTVTFFFDGSPLTVPEGTSVAAALLLNGAGAFRTTPVSSAPRAPYCMMGVCFDCLLEIDGVPSQQACLTAVRDGMDVRRQFGAGAVPEIVEGDGNAHQ
jgi:D-hydroxyproline dehydrogenase subunit gamma